MQRKLPIVILTVAVLAALPVPAADGPKPEAIPGPDQATETAPDLFRVKFVTTAGDFVVEAHRDWAPNGVDRFFNLVKIGYYSDCAFFRVIQSPRPFMAQVGMHGDPDVNKVWRTATIADDPIVKSNTRGMVTFAKTNRPNSRSTQFFVNYTDNSYLDKHGFAPFGQVVEGMTTVMNLYSGYGEGAPTGKGPHQQRLALEGNAYLKAEFDKLDYILSAEILPAVTVDSE
jgi:peptidyl-prolyl cis-trans isomerase A (cyclophilin A)